MIDSGLDIADLEAIKAVLSNYPEVEKVLLYGSRAMNRFKPASDIDLSLIGDKIDSAILSAIEFDLDDLMLPYKFDISIYHKITNPDFTDHINRVGVDFYMKDA